METMKIKYTLSHACKVIDGFSGRPLENAVVLLDGLSRRVGERFTPEFQYKRLKNKGNGFYIAIDLEDGEHLGSVECHGYETQAFTFIANEKDPEIELITMIPAHADDRIDLEGRINRSGKLAKEFTFYYSVDCDEYRKRVSSDVGKSEGKIRLHSYQEDSLEGRRFAVEAVSGIYTLGNFDYVDKEYKLSQTMLDEVEMGAFAYLLFQGKTDSEGRFHIAIPRHIAGPQIDVIFFSEYKSCRVTLDLDEKEKSPGKSDRGPVTVKL